MFAHVALLNGFEKELLYKIPDHLASSVQVGTVVNVPLQKRFEPALITSIETELEKQPAFTIKEIRSLGPFPHDQHYHAFIEKIAQFYLLNPLHFYHRMRHFLREKDRDETVTDAQSDASSEQCTLTEEQQTIVGHVIPSIINPSYKPTLIHGVTGSGKTEVYKRLIETAIAENKSVIMLLPEVTLALQFQHLLAKQLPTVPIVGFHSATKIAEKRLLWQMLMDQKPLLIIGVHQPIMLPINNLGLIIIDEEHEAGFQEKKHPKLNSKQIALWRAHTYGIPIVLGSATPSLNSLHTAKRHNWNIFSITKRFAGSFPTVEKVVLTDQINKRRKNFWVSKQLESAIADRLAKKEQIIIFLNRRGYSFFVQCKECGFIFECPNCSVSLTLHNFSSSSLETALQASSGQRGSSSVRPEEQAQLASRGVLRCHYCDHHKPLPLACPQCKADEKALIKKGVGTQQVVQIFKDLFPTAIIERADMDSTTKKRSWQNTVEQFSKGAIDILIGTQTITKGYHFPNVTLVGILWADLNLHFPLYNASEITLQQLIQVAGRAGRQRAGGKVIVQVMRDHPIFNYLDEQKYLDFCASELETRRESFYPPFARLASIEFKHTDSLQIDKDAEEIANALHAANDNNQLGVTILGPALPIIHRIQNCEMRQILLKSDSFKNLHTLLLVAKKIYTRSDMFIVMNH